MVHVPTSCQIIYANKQFATEDSVQVQRLWTVDERVKCVVGIYYCNIVEFIRRLLEPSFLFFLHIQYMYWCIGILVF